MELLVRIESIIYQKDNFYVLNTDQGKAKGYIFDNGEADIRGMKYLLVGEWENGKYGKVFSFTSASMQSDQLFFFLSKIVKVGEKISLEIINTFGDELEYIIETEPEKLLEIKGIGEKRLQKIIRDWKKYGHLRALAKFLNPYNISATLITKIYNRFGEDSIMTIKRNPYSLTQINGIGFLTADKIALQLGIKEDSPERIVACAEYILQEEGNNNGHCYLPLTELAEKVRDTIQVNASVEIHCASDERFHISEQGYIGFNSLYIMEKYIHKRLSEDHLCPLFSEEEVIDFIQQYEKENSISFSDEQKQAIMFANKYKLFTLTGYAGTGKSSVTRAILTLLSKKFARSQIVGCALSGIASRRLSQASGFNAYTIHSLLQYGGDGFGKNEENPLEEKVVVVDECGMINIHLFYNLFKAIPKDTRVILVGDDAQLPPIGAGNVFADIIHKNSTPIIRLVKVFRQSAQSVINVFAQDIRLAMIPEDYKKKYDDWLFFDCSVPNYFQRKNNCKTEADKKLLREEMNNVILHKTLKIIESGKNSIKDIITDLQILVPQRKGVLGYDLLNNYVQQILNDPDKKAENEKIERLGRWFCIGDKIVHTENKDMKCIRNINDFLEDKNDDNVYTKRIFNGTLGIIRRIDHDRECIIAEMVTDDIVVYDFIEAKDIFDLAYVLTVHKAQGSEFRNVIIPLSLSNYIMLQNQWLYTAITRAKSKVLIVAEDLAFRTACQKNEKKYRNTWLSIL